MTILQKLIQIPSVSGEEGKIQEFIVTFLSEIGLAPFYVGENVVAKIAGKNNEKAIIFNTHVDTVPVGSIDSWQHPPFKGEIVKGKMYGLGASDNKASVAAALLLAEDLAINKPAVDVWLTYVVNEEIDGSGTAEVVKWFAGKEQKKYSQVAAVIGEPTDLINVKIANRGNLFVKVTVSGDSGHGSRPQYIKTHAVLEMVKVAAKMEKLGKVWAKKYPDGLLGVPTIGLLTSISAGSLTSPNKFPDSCTATFDVRTTPKMHDLALKQIEKTLAGAKVGLVYPAAPYGYTDEQETIVQITKKICGGNIIASRGSTDLCFFTAAGIPGVVFGPGIETTSHGPNEWCPVAAVPRCAKIYAEIINQFGL